jgi:hypothetical protein
MRKHMLWAAVAMLVLPMVATAAAPQKPGRWETTVQMEMPGMDVQLPPMTTAVCLTKEDVANPDKALPKASDAGCTVSDYKVTGNTATWAMKCATPQGAMTGKGSITYSDAAYTGSMDLTVSEQQLHAKLTGKFKGECDGSEMKTKK